jgi:hypothetical protein
MVAGWQVGADGTAEVFTETEVALENAVAGSGTTLKYVYEYVWDCGETICLYYPVCYYGPGFC